jgi:hypothetical protein
MCVGVATAALVSRVARGQVTSLDQRPAAAAIACCQFVVSAAQWGSSKGHKCS